MAVIPDAPSSPAPAPGRPHGVGSIPVVGHFLDWAFKQLCMSSALLMVAAVGIIVLLLAVEAQPALREVGTQMLTSQKWMPMARYVEDPDDEDAPKTLAEPAQFSALPFIYGSVVTSLLAMLIAVPLGVGTAAFLSEIAPPKVKRVGSFLIELLAAIPSVVYGFWGVNFLAPPLGDLFEEVGQVSHGGRGLLAAGIILAIMIVPYIAAVSYDVCQAVPSAQRHGSLALGATRWQTISRVVLPFALPGIVGGCFLALGRALGETMAITMLIGNTAEIKPLPFGLGSTIPSVLVNELPSNTGPLHYSALIELSLLLFGVAILMNVLARLLIWRVGKMTAGPSLWSLAWRPILAVGLVLLGTWGWRFLRSAVVWNLENLPVVQIVCVVGGFVVLLWGLSQFPVLWKRLAAAQFVNNVMTGVLGLCLVVTCVPLFLILGYILYRGVGGLDWSFFTSSPYTGGGLLNAMVGSGIIVGLSALISVPLGLMSAIYLAEYRTRRVGHMIRFFGELLIGVPSIVIGTFVYVFVELIRNWGWVSSQFSGWAGVLALTIMMVPIVMRAAEESLKLVPGTLRNASHALGAYHWQTILRVSVPAALPAIITGAFLATARIAGETAPLLLTAFGNDNLTLSPGDQMAFIPKYIYYYATLGDKALESKAWAAALVLVSFIMILNVGVRFLTGKRVVLASRAD